MTPTCSLVRGDVPPTRLRSHGIHSIYHGGQDGTATYFSRRRFLLRKPGPRSRRCPASQTLQVPNLARSTRCTPGDSPEAYWSRADLFEGDEEDQVPHL